MFASCYSMEMVTDDMCPGQKLRSIREMQGISLSDVAGNTKIAVSSLKALEDENFAELPKGVYARSFIRTYSGVLGLDPEVMISEFVESYPDEVGRRSEFGNAEGNSTDEYQSQQSMARTAVVVAGLSIPCLIFVAYVGLHEAAETDELIATEKVESIVASPRLAVGSVSTERSFVPDDREVVSSEQELVIELAPQADCWVSAVVDGAESLSKLMRSGDREIIRFTDRAVLNVGDAGVLSLKINNRLAKSLGGNGEVVTATIDRSNYQTYFLD